MAACDYYSCDICGKKTFYDANVRYDDDEGKIITDEKGEPIPYNVGAMAVLCLKCAENYQIIIKEKP